MRRLSEKALAIRRLNKEVIATIRNAALEEAAKVAEDWDCANNAELYEFLVNLPAAIRALKEDKP